jgi:alpha-L-rhamnosidase
MPRLTYHGFRYVEVYNYPGNLNAESIRRKVINTAMSERATASFDDEVLQAIHEGSKGAQRSNLNLVPSDCPQRDERLGWMGDASLSAQSMLRHFDIDAYAAAFVDSMVDAMSDDGSLPDVVPFQRFGGIPADLSWSAAFLSMLTSLWKEAHDLAPARKHWGAVKTHVASLRSRAGSLQKLPEPYGDWCPPPATHGRGDKEMPSKGFAAAFSLVQAIQQAADLGKALGGEAAGDAKAFADLAGQLRDEFHNGFFNASTKQYDNGAMITDVLPLALGAVPDSLRGTVVENLLQHIQAKNGTWSGGIINNRFLFDVLHENGHADVALAMLKKRTYPSYGYMYFNDLEPARECMWELPDAPYQGTGMNSRNHHMFSSVGHYLVTRVAGLANDEDDALKLNAVVGTEKNVQASLQTLYGVAYFSWTRSLGSGLQIQVVVPMGMSARLHVPQGEGAVTSVQGHSIVSEVGKRHGSAYNMITLSSGRHQFITSGSNAVYV